MTFLLILLALALVSALRTLHAMTHDSRGTRLPPRSHAEDPQFRSPAF